MKNKLRRCLTAGALTLIFPTTGILYLIGTKSADKALDENTNPSMAGKFTLQVDMITEFIDDKMYALWQRKHLKKILKK